MAGTILVSPEELRQQATSVTARAHSSEHDLAVLRGQLLGLQHAFQGRAATAFTAHYEQWHTSATQLASALEALGRFLAHSAATLEQTDAELAAHLS